MQQKKENIDCNKNHFKLIGLYVSVIARNTHIPISKPFPEYTLKPQLAFILHGYT